MTKLEAPKKFFKAIRQVNYEGLSKAEVSEVNNLLLDNQCSFLDCVNVFSGYKKDHLIYIFN